MWTGTDEYLDRMYQRYLKVKEIIKEKKESPDDDIKLLAEYTEDLMLERDDLDKENHKYFDAVWIVKCERDDYIKYSSWLEDTLKAKLKNDETWLKIIENKKEKIINYDYDKRYKEIDLWIDLTRR